MAATLPKHTQDAIQRAFRGLDELRTLNASDHGSQAWREAQAAEQAGTNPRAIRRAAAVAEGPSDLLNKVLEGQLSLSAAAQLVKVAARATNPMTSRQSQEQRKLVDAVAQKGGHLIQADPHIRYEQLNQLPEEDRQQWLQQLKQARAMLGRLIRSL